MHWISSPNPPRISRIHFAPVPPHRCCHLRKYYYIKLFHTFIQQAAYDVLVENRKTALRRSGSMILHGDEGRMTAEEIAEAINKNPNYGWHYHPLTADQVSEALMEVVRTDKRFAWFRSFYPEQIKFGAYYDDWQESYIWMILMCCKFDKAPPILRNEGWRCLGDVKSLNFSVIFRVGALGQRFRAEMSLKSVAEHSWGTKMTQCVAWGILSS